MRDGNLQKFVQGISFSFLVLEVTMRDGNTSFPATNHLAFTFRFRSDYEGWKLVL
jgi:hypothetical protein